MWEKKKIKIKRFEEFWDGKYHVDYGWKETDEEAEKAVLERFTEWKYKDRPAILSINFGTDYSNKCFFIEVLYEKEVDIKEEK